MIAEVIVDIATSELDKIFDYAITSNDICVGSRVIVPFGNRKTSGFVINVKENSSINSSKLKPILRVVDAIPALTKESLELYKYVSKKYHVSQALSLRLFLTSEMRKGKVREKSVNFIELAVFNEDYDNAVNSIKSKDVKKFVKDYFVTQNMEIYITSPKSLKKVKKLVENELVAKIPSNPNFKPLPLFLPTKDYQFFYEVETKDIDKCYLYINFKSTISYFDIQKRQQLNLMLDMINETSEGIMKELRLEKSLIYGGGFYVVYNANRSVIDFETECNKANVNEIITTVQEYIEKILNNGFDEELFNKVKR